MSWDSIESGRRRASVVGEWEPALSGPSLLHLRRARRPRTRLILRRDGTADWPGHRPPGSPPLPPAPFPMAWRLSDDWVLTIVRPVPPMPWYDMPDWSREEEDFRVLESEGDVLCLACGDVYTVFRRVHDEEYERWLADGAREGNAAEPPAAPNPHRDAGS
jgi:hypothetical protein